MMLCWWWVGWCVLLRSLWVSVDWIMTGCRSVLPHTTVVAGRINNTD